VEIRRRIVQKEGRDHHEDLRLPIVEVPGGLGEDADVALLAPNRDRRRMLTGARQPRAVGGTLNLHEPLGSAADSADLFVERRTAAPCAPDAA
jgi:hypothetical protein